VTGEPDTQSSEDAAESGALDDSGGSDRPPTTEEPAEGGDETA
jgi:hypothetical protein